MYTFENYGEIKVVNSNDEPQSEVYVKAFIKLNDESVKFCKDGYTDFRGRFSYAETNSIKL